MDSQHRAVLATVARMVDSESIGNRDREELIEACRTLAGWLRQYVEVAAEQDAEIVRLSEPRPVEPGARNGMIGGTTGPNGSGRR